MKQGPKYVAALALLSTAWATIFLELAGPPLTDEMRQVVAAVRVQPKLHTPCTAPCLWLYRMASYSRMQFFLRSLIAVAVVCRHMVWLLLAGNHLAQPPATARVSRGSCRTAAADPPSQRRSEAARTEGCGGCRGLTLSMSS